MIKRGPLVFVGLVIFLVFLSGCVTEKSGKNLTNLEKNPSIPSISPSVNATIKTPVTTMVVKTSPTPGSSWRIRLAQNETADNHINDNMSYELSLSDISFSKGGRQGETLSYVTTINITAKNNGLDPVRLTIGGVSFLDDSGDGCRYSAPHWCGRVIFDTLNPGESQMETMNIFFYSKKPYEYLSSQKFEYLVEITAENIGIKGYWGGNPNSWIIDMDNST